MKILVTDGHHRSRRQEDRLRRVDRELQAVRQTSEALLPLLDPDEIMQKALDTALAVVEAESGSLFIADSQLKELVVRYSIGATSFRPGIVIHWNHGLVGTVFQSGEPLIERAGNTEGGRVRDDRPACADVPRELILIPLKRWEGEPIGVLEVVNKRGGWMNEDDVAVLTVVSAITTIALTKARSFHKATQEEMGHMLDGIRDELKRRLMPVLSRTKFLESQIKRLQNQP